MTTIAVLNQKGGVGKTTTAVTLAAGLSQVGLRTLLIDLDTQGNVADSLGIAPGDELRRLLSPDIRQSLQELVIPARQTPLALIRSDKTTAALKQVLAGVTLREYALAEALDGAPYEAIFLDCAPSVDLLHYAAIVAADYILLPTRLDKLSVVGVRDALSSMAALQHVHPSRLAGIVPTFFERVTSESFDQLTFLAETFGPHLLPPIPLDTNCRVASRLGQTLWDFAPHTRALSGYELGGKQVGGYRQLLLHIQELV